jgi:uncharacterized repeat protein (TIGR01451 family)
VLRYRVRVLNNDVFAQTPVSQTLTNNATLSYTVAGNPVTQPSTASVTVLQPILTVSKSVAPAGGDTVINAGEVITYTVDILNSGAAPAYDTVLVDTLPVGLRRRGRPFPSRCSRGGPLTASPSSIHHRCRYPNFDTGAQMPIHSSAVAARGLSGDGRCGPRSRPDPDQHSPATLYYSFDDEAVPNATLPIARYGPTNTAQQRPSPHLCWAGCRSRIRRAPPQQSARSSLHHHVPATRSRRRCTMYAFSITRYECGLTLVSISTVSGSPAWTPVNTGTSTDLVIEDTTNGGIEIPANEQIVIGVTVRMNNVAGNIAGLAFSNTASYTYNRLTVLAPRPGAAIPPPT